jgi:DNA-binding transcriptional regulator YiaG
MAKNWREIRKQLSPEREMRVKQRVNKELERLSLPKLRVARNLTQESLARTLNVKQSAVSRLEQRADMYVSTLRSYLKAMGADLQVKAVFPDGEVEIEQFEEIQPKRKSA